MFELREMKDSGIDFIGKIPKNWLVSRVKFYCTMNSGDNITAQDIETEGRYPVYGGNGLRGYFSKYNFDGKYILIGRQGALAGNVHRVSDKFWSTDHAVVTNVFESADLSFFYYLFIAMNLNQYAFDTAAQPGLAVSKIMGLSIAIPPIIKEQYRIAKFLDIKCFEINAVIENIRKQVDTLEQYKQSTITEVVTKGLNAKVEMKDSGIEWIGEIPLDWETRKIGRLFTLRNEKNYKPLDEVQLLSLYTDIGIFPHGEQEERGNKAVKAEGYNIVKKNDIVVNIILAWMGAIGISEYDGVTSPAYDVYMSDTSKVVPHYYHYVFRTKAIAGECYKHGRGIMLMRWRTYSSEFKQISVPFPPIEEQQAIANYLDDKCDKINKIIEEKKKQMVTIEEYKNALIFEYVTGKKETKD